MGDTESSIQPASGDPSLGTLVVCPLWNFVPLETTWDIPLICPLQLDTRLPGSLDLDLPRPFSHLMDRIKDGH